MKNIPHQRKKFFLSQLQVVLIVIVIVFFGLLFSSAKIIENKKTKPPVIPPTPQCTSPTTVSCSDGTTVVTQDCVDGKLISTRKECPCIRNTTLSCEDGSTITIQNCVNGTLIGTGKVCPCIADTKATCYDGASVITQNCVNGTLISTGKACPTPPPAPAPTPPPASVYPKISTTELQSIMQKFPQIMSIKDPKIKMQFHDNNTLYLGYTYFIGAGGAVSSYSGQAYDMWLTINVYDALNLGSSNDVCASLKTTIQAGRAYVLEQSSNPLTLLKYMSMKPCVM